MNALLNLIGKMLPAPHHLLRFFTMVTHSTTYIRSGRHTGIGAWLEIKNFTGYNRIIRHSNQLVSLTLSYFDIWIFNAIPFLATPSLWFPLVQIPSGSASTFTYPCRNFTTTCKYNLLAWKNVHDLLKSLEIPTWNVYNDTLYAKHGHIRGRRASTIFLHGRMCKPYK
jgi:hypothetical protein